MDFIIKRFNSLFGIAISAIIVIGVIYLFINILPFILIIGLIAWMFFKGIKILKSFNSKKESVITSMKDDQVHNNADSNEFTNGQVIDVEYKEVK